MADKQKRSVGRPRKLENLVKNPDSSIIEVHPIEKGAKNPNYIMDSTLKLQMFQIRTDLNRWIAAINQAESVLIPDRTELMQVYKDIKLDAHLSGIMNAIKEKVKSKEFQLVNEKGDEDLKAYEIFEHQWFFDWIDYVIESDWEGFSLVQLGPIINNSFKYIELVPRQYVVPEWNLVKHTLYITTKDGGTNYIEDKKYSPWTIILDNKHLGILNKCVPYMIGKKSVFLFWGQFAELFGMPFREGRTDIRDVSRRKNMENMLQNMGSAGWGVFDTDDTLNLIENGSTDAFNIYKEYITLANSEISKLLAGQTMMFDNGSSRSQSEVHQDLFDDILTSFMRKIRFRTNTDLIPKMINLGIKGLDGLKFRYEFEDEVKYNDKVKLIHDLGQVGYKFAPEYIDEYLELGASGKIELVQQMPQGLPKDLEGTKNVLNELPWFTYLNKVQEMKMDKSKLDIYRKMYKHIQ